MKNKISIILSLVLMAMLLFGATASAEEPSYDSSLTLENKTGDWEGIEDGTYGELLYNASGSEFEYNFKAWGLEHWTNYSLIYYADPWAGDNPGAVIATLKTGALGGTAWYPGGGISGSIELNMNLPSPPDGNYPTGAKIWLVPSDMLTDGTALPMVAWDHTRILFETKLINYIDTDLIVDEEEVPFYMPPPDFSFCTRWGYPAMVYYQGDGLPNNVMAWGTYGGTRYKFEFEAGTVITGAKSIFLSDVVDGVLYFGNLNTVTFSKPVKVYAGEGRFYMNNYQKWVGGTWTEIGSFSEIVDGRGINADK